MHTTDPRSKRVGFIGLGVMGGQLARRLLDAGHQLTVCDVSADAVQTLTDAGAATAATPVELAGMCEVVFTSLPKPEHVRDVLTGADGVLAAPVAGLTVIDMSTIGPIAAEELAQTAAAAGVSMLDCPVGGGWMEARDGTLVLMVGGDAAVLDRHRDLLDVLGKAVFHFGGPGTGQATKVALNMSQAVLTAGAAEAVRLLRAGGVDLDAFLRTLESLDANPWFQRPLRHTIDGRFDPGFRIDLMAKDVDLALSSGNTNHVSLPAGELAGDLFRQAQRTGLGDLHISGLVKLYDDPDQDR